jgi:hypothetical protein
MSGRCLAIIDLELLLDPPAIEAVSSSQENDESEAKEG